MMGRWRVEGSRDGVVWDEIAAFFGSSMAMEVFRVELVRERFPFLRLQAPDGVIHERARLRPAAAG